MAFIQALRDQASQGILPVIPDIKCISPKEGDLLRGRDAVVLAQQLAAAGAPVLSVVTEPEHFGGSLSLLSRIVEATERPVLRKDFIQQEQQIRETAAAGARAVLLIVSMLEQDRLEALLEASRECGLTPFVEIHSEAELHRVNPLTLPLIGINNRDILTLERDNGSVGTTESLIRQVAGEPLIVSESGVQSQGDVLRASAAGAAAVLVGTALLQAPCIGEMYKQLSVGLL